MARRAGVKRPRAERFAAFEVTPPDDRRAPTDDRLRVCNVSVTSGE